MPGASQAVTLPMRTADYASEADLLAGCRRQDIRAFERLYEAHGPRLKSVALHILGNREDAEDAVQETFVKVFRAIRGFQGESGVGTWLYRILINICYDVARKRKREADPEEHPMEREAAPSGQPA